MIKVDTRKEKLLLQDSCTAGIEFQIISNIKIQTYVLEVYSIFSYIRF